MRLLPLLLLVLLACGSPPVATQTPTPATVVVTPAPSAVAFTPTPVPENETVEQYARRVAGKQSYGVYVTGKKAGWARMSLEVKKVSGREVAVYTDEFHFRVTYMGQPTRLSLESRTEYALQGDGRILGASLTKDEDGTVTKTRVTPHGEGKLRIVSQGAGRQEERVVPMPRDNLRQAQELERWLSTAEAGDTFTDYAVSWDEDPLESEDLYTFDSREGIVWGGVETEMYRVTVKSKGMTTQTWLQRDGTPWKATVGGFIEMRAEDEETARKLDTPVDMLAVSAIPVEPALKKGAEKVKHLVLQVEGAGNFEFPTSHRQKVTRRNGKLELILQRDFRIPKAQPLPAADRKRYLAGTPTVQVDGVMRAQARKIAPSGSPLQRAEKLLRWVYKNLSKTSGKNASSARDVLANRGGDCTEHTVLFVALARASGIPARETGGLMYASGFFAWHAWAEIHDGHQWVGMDPTWNEVLIDATHIKMQRDEEDHAWINVAGQLRLKVLKADYLP